MKRVVASAISVILIFSICLAGCGLENNQDMASLSSADQTEEALSQEGGWEFEDEVVVGRVVPATGVLSSFGEGTPYVEELAIQAINDTGGVVVDGKRCSLRLVCRDSGSTMKGAEEAAEELIREGIDVMIVSNTADTVLPVSAVCEREEIICLSVDAPASAWIMGGPYTNSWLAHFDNEREMLCFYDVWERVETNKKIGLMTANDSEGVEIRTFIHDFASSKGYEIVDAGAYYIGEEDFSEYIECFEENQCDIILGVMITEDFMKFWSQMDGMEYQPKMCTVAKACLFEQDINRLGALGDGLITEVWWTADFPYTSSIDGMTCRELGDIYLKYCQPELNAAPATAGYKYGNVEILYDVLKRAGTLDLDVLNETVKNTDLDTIIGHVEYNDDHISLMPCVTGQWVWDEGQKKYKKEIVGNYLIPSVEITADVKLLGNEE